MTYALYIGAALVFVALAYALGRLLRRPAGPAAPNRLRPGPAPAALAPAPALDHQTLAVVGWLVSQAFEQTGVNVSSDKLAYDRITAAARKAIQELQTQEDTIIRLPFLTADPTGPKHLEARLTRAAIEELVKQ